MSAFSEGEGTYDRDDGSICSSAVAATGIFVVSSCKGGGKTPKSKEDGFQCSGSQTSASDNCNADQCCQEPSGCDGGDDAGPAENVCKCETGGTSQLCAEGQYCSTDDDTSTCTNEKPVKCKPTSECGANSNTATAPMTNEAAAAKIQKLKDLEAWFRMNFAATKMQHKSAESLTACKEISTKWKDAECSSKTCDSSDSANTACCKSGSDETSSKCEDSESEWRKSVGAKGPGGNEVRTFCNVLLWFGRIRLCVHCTSYCTRFVDWFFIGFYSIHSEGTKRLTNHNTHFKV